MVVVNIPSSVVEIEYRGVNYRVVESNLAIVVDIENDDDYDEKVVISSYYCVVEWAQCANDHFPTSEGLWCATYSYKVVLY